MNINPFAVQAPDSVEHTISKASATCVRFNHGKSLFAGHYMAAGRTDGGVLILSVETKNVLRVLEGHVKAVTSVNWSRYNRYLATSSLDCNIIVWDLQRGERLHTIRFDAPVSNVYFSATSSKVLVAILQSQEAVLVNLRRRRKRLPRHEGAANGVDALISTMSSLSVSAIVESRAALCVESGDSVTILCAAFAVDNSNTLVLGTSKGDLLVVDLDTHAVLTRVSCGASGVREVAFDHLGRTLVTNSNDRAVRLFSYAVRRPVIDKHEDGTPATSEDDERVVVTPLHRFQDLVNRTPWSGVGFSGDAEYVFGGATHKAAHNIYIWDRGAGVLDKILQGPRDSLVNVDWHPNRPMLASVSHTGAINVWFNGPTPVYSAYAPGFEELEENVTYEEREDEFDLEDEEEVTRRKRDEEEAHVDIVSSGPQFHSSIGAAARRRKKRENGNERKPPHPKLKEDDVDEVLTDTDDEDEEFVIPVRLSLDLPDLEEED